MSKPTDSLTTALIEFLKTPNGQVRLVGSIMLIGPAYYVITGDAKESEFLYGVMGLGFVLVMISIGLAIWSAIIKNNKDKDA